MVLNTEIKAYYKTSLLRKEKKIKTANKQERKKNNERIKKDVTKLELYIFTNVHILVICWIWRFFFCFSFFLNIGNLGPYTHSKFIREF